MRFARTSIGWLSFIILLAFCGQLAAENLYLRAGATGAETGLNWNDAWSSTAKINWGNGGGRLSGGDKLWVAGGNYGKFDFGKASIGNGKVTILRADASSINCSSISGWSAAYDSPVYLETTNLGQNADKLDLRLRNHWFVRSQATGHLNGRDWNNAWALNGINWATIYPGDSIWLAGGVYTNAFTFGKKGAPDSLIYFKRALAADPIPAATAGWNSLFDTNILVSPNSPTVLYFVNSAENGSYFYVDGRTDGGIKLQANNSPGSYNAPLFIGALSDIHDTTFANIDCAGPDDGTNPNYAHLGNNAALTIRANNGQASIFNTISNLTFYGCRFHGAANLVTMVYGINIFWDKCKFYDNVAIGTSGQIAHQNMFEFVGVGNLTLRNCEMWNWAVEGLMPYGTSRGPIYMYGCVWHDCYLYPDNSTVARVLEVFTSYQVVFYNNTFVNLPYAVYSAAGGGNYADGSIARNNIYWNCAIGSLPLPMDYEFSNASVSGSNSISAGLNPFVNLNGKDYRLGATVGVKYPKDKGVTLSSPNNISFDLDINGSKRGADGLWDIGAFEFVPSQ